MPTNNSINAPLPIEVINGGTDIASASPYAVITGGATTTAPIQFVSGTGTTGQVLTSSGTGVPTWQNAATVGGWVLLETQTTASASMVFNTGITSTYSLYLLNFYFTYSPASNVDVYLAFSTDGGANPLPSSGGAGKVLRTPYNSSTIATRTSSANQIFLTAGSAFATSFIQGYVYIYGMGQFVPPNLVDNNASPAYIFGQSLSSSRMFIAGGEADPTDPSPVINAFFVNQDSGLAPTTAAVSLYGLQQ